MSMGKPAESEALGVGLWLRWPKSWLQKNASRWQRKQHMEEESLQISKGGVTPGHHVSWQLLYECRSYVLINVLLQVLMKPQTMCLRKEPVYMTVLLNISPRTWPSLASILPTWSHSTDDMALCDLIYLPRRDGRLSLPWCWLSAAMVHLSATMLDFHSKENKDDCAVWSKEHHSPGTVQTHRGRVWKVKRWVLDGTGKQLWKVCRWLRLPDSLSHIVIIGKNV